ASDWSSDVCSSDLLSFFSCGDLAEQNFDTVVQTDDLFCLITMFTFRAVAFQRILGMATAYLCQRSFTFARHLCSFAKSSFLCFDIVGKLVFMFDRALYLIVESANKLRKKLALGGEELPHQNAVFLLKNFVASCFCCLATE